MDGPLPLLSAQVKDHKTARDVPGGKGEGGKKERRKMGKEGEDKDEAGWW